MKKRRLCLAPGLLAVLVACGGSDPLERTAEFAQNVNEVPYALQRVLIDSEITYEDGTVVKMSSEILNRDLIRNERVSRVTSNDQYVLVVNGERAAINIGSSSEFDSVTEKRQEDGCTLIGNSRVRGQARYDRLNIQYELKNRLNGKLCPLSIVEDYEDFQERQLLGLRLNVVTQLLDSGFWDLADSRDVLIRIRIEGVATLIE